MSAQMAFALFLVVVLLAIAFVFIHPKKKGPDSVITATVNELLAKEFPLGNTHIEVKTFDGVVILGGSVREPEELKRAVEVASEVSGVKSVDNRMSVRAGR